MREDSRDPRASPGAARGTFLREAAADADITQLLARWSNGERSALDALIPTVYQELRQLAASHLQHEGAGTTISRTALVHDLYLRLAGGHAFDVGGRRQFFGLASTVMRHILIDHARARRAAKRDGGQRVTLDTAGTMLAPDVHVANDDAFALIAFDEALRRLEQLDARQMRLVEMRFFGGLSVEATAEALEISPATVKREWATARAWLLRELGLSGTSTASAP